MSDTPGQEGWQRSSRCETRDCFEVVIDGGQVRVRNSTNPSQVITGTLGEWAALVQGVKADEFPTA